MTSDTLTVAVLHGDQTGEELLEQTLRILDGDLLGVPLRLHHYDLSLANRRATDNQVVTDAAAGIASCGYGLKAATITPEQAGDVGSPNQLLREGINGQVIIRTGRPLPGVKPLTSVTHPISVVRTAVGDAYGAQEWRDDQTGEAFRTERITADACNAVARHAFQLAADADALVLGGPKFTVSPTYEGQLKEALDREAQRWPQVPYQPMLIDALYAALISGRYRQPLVVPALNRDGDCLSDLVMQLFGSLAAAESVIVGDRCVMVEAPHGTAPDLEGLNAANPLAMILAVAALLNHADHQNIGARVRAAAIGSIRDGVKTRDLGGDSSTSDFMDQVIARLR